MLECSISDSGTDPSSGKDLASGIVHGSATRPLRVLLRVYDASFHLLTREGQVVQGVGNELRDAESLFT